MKTETHSRGIFLAGFCQLFRRTYGVSFLNFKGGKKIHKIRAFKPTSLLARSGSLMEAFHKAQTSVCNMRQKSSQQTVKSAPHWEQISLRSTFFCSLVVMGNSVLGGPDRYGRGPHTGLWPRQLAEFMYHSSELSELPSLANLLSTCHDSLNFWFFMPFWVL